MLAAVISQKALIFPLIGSSTLLDLVIAVIFDEEPAHGLAADQASGWIEHLLVAVGATAFVVLGLQVIEVVWDLVEVEVKVRGDKEELQGQWTLFFWNLWEA